MRPCAPSFRVALCPTRWSQSPRAPPTQLPSIFGTESMRRSARIRCPIRLRSFASVCTVSRPTSACVFMAQLLLRPMPTAILPQSFCHRCSLRHTLGAPVSLCHAIEAARPRPKGSVRSTRARRRQWRRAPQGPKKARILCDHLTHYKQGGVAEDCRRGILALAVRGPLLG